MKAVWTAAVLATGAAVSGVAAADEDQLQVPGASLLLHAPQGSTEDVSKTREPAEAGTFDGLGQTGRVWEVSSEASFSAGASRVATEELSLARLFSLSRTVGVVARLGFGVDADTSQSGVNSIQGLLPSLGARLTSPKSEDSWIEFGARLVPPWPAVRPGDPSGLGLALQATLSSQTADDARWLTFASTGYQVYMGLQSRVELVDKTASRLAIGARYGVITSLLPLQIQTWLGPESGIVGDTYVDLFADFTRLATCPVNLEIGARGEASLSSIWPSNAALPVGVDGYLGWSPAPWLVLRAFAGYAVSPVNTSKPLFPYGLRAIVYFDASGNPPG